MDWTQSADYFLIVMTLCVLASASLSDYRKRTISDIHWVILGVSGISVNGLVSVCCSGSYLWAVTGIVSGGLFLFSVLGNDGDVNMPALGVSVAVALFSFFIGHTSSAFPTILGLLFLICYWGGIVRGGADTKCLIALAYAVPLIEVSPTGTPIDLLFSTPVLVLFLASVFSVAGCSAYCLVRNLRDHEGLSVRSFVMGIDSARTSFVWPMEDVRDGVVAKCPICRDEEISEVYGRLESAGVEKVRVTPMVPFIVPIAMAFLCVLLFGNPFTAVC